jgi:hypothetical protein
MAQEIKTLQFIEGKELTNPTEVTQFPVGFPLAENQAINWNFLKHFEMNYLFNSHFENGISNWETYVDSAQNSPYDGTGYTASPAFTLSSYTTAPLRGSASLKVVKAAQNAKGHGFSVPFTIDHADKFKMLEISFDVKTLTDIGFYTNPVNAGDLAGLMVWVVDSTNIVQLQASPSQVVIGDATQSAKFYGAFQATGSTSYRLCLHCPVTDTNAYELIFDNFIVRPQRAALTNLTDPSIEVLNASLVTYWDAYFSTRKQRISRSADKIRLDAEFVLSGAVGISGSFYLNAVSGYAIDTTKMALGSGKKVVGQAYVFNNSGFAEYFGAVYYDTVSNAFKISLGGSDLTDTAPFSMNANSVVRVSFEYYVQGYDVATRVGSDAEIRRVAMSRSVASATSATFTGADNVLFTFTALDSISNYDTMGGNLLYNSTNGRFFAPFSGWYDFECALAVGGTFALNSQVRMQLVKYNSAGTAGSAFRQSEFLAAAAISRAPISIATKVYLVAGESFAVRLLTTSVTTPVLTGSNTTNSFASFARIANGHAAPYAGEAVACKISIFNGVSQSIANGATPVKIQFNNKYFDTHNAFDVVTNYRFTAPLPGRYLVTVQITYASAAWLATSNNVLYVRKNGDSSGANQTVARNAITTAATFEPSAVEISTVETLGVGDYLEFFTTHGEAAARSLINDNQKMQVSIARIGNA